MSNYTNGFSLFVKQSIHAFSFVSSSFNMLELLSAAPQMPSPDEHFRTFSENVRRLLKIAEDCWELFKFPACIYNSMMHAKARIKGSVIKLTRSSGDCLLTRALLMGLRGLVLFAGLVLCWYCLDRWRRTSLLNFLERDLDSFGDELPKGAE